MTFITAGLMTWPGSLIATTEEVELTAVPVIGPNFAVAGVRSLGGAARAMKPHPAWTQVALVSPRRRTVKSCSRSGSGRAGHRACLAGFCAPFLLWQFRCASGVLGT